MLPIGETSPWFASRRAQHAYAAGTLINPLRDCSLSNPQLPTSNMTGAACHVGPACLDSAGSSGNLGCEGDVHAGPFGGLGWPFSGTADCTRNQ